MKQILPSIALFLFFLTSTPLLRAQEYLFRTTPYFYRIGTDSLQPTGLTLNSFDFSSANRTTDSMFTDGIYFPANDCFGRNLWIRVRHIAEDPNGTNRGFNVGSTSGNPCAQGGNNITLGGWNGFLYDIEIHSDTALTATRSFHLGGLYPTSITVASLEWMSGTCGGSEWVNFGILNQGSTGWSLNSINFTGVNVNSNPGFSDTMAVYTTGGCYPPDGFSYTFPTGADSISFINASAVGYSEFKMSAGSVSHFIYGYEYSSGGYQGMSMAFGSPPTYSFSAQDVTCQNGNNGEITVNISGGIGPFTYAWSDSTATGNSLTGLSSGTYRLTVIDQNGCGQVADTTILINEPTGVTVALDAIQTTHVSCFGRNDGSIVLTASGVPDITFNWNNKAGSDSSLTDLTAGIYQVTVSDYNSCLVFTDTITQPDAIDISTAVNGNTITALEVAATYQWLNCTTNAIVPDSTNASITPAATGTYRAIITKNDCVDTTACVTVTINGIEEKMVANAVSISPNPATNKVSIGWNKPGTPTLITITDLSGRIITSETETTGSSIQLDLQQPKGIYFVTVKNISGTAIKKLVIE